VILEEGTYQLEVENVETGDVRSAGDYTVTRPDTSTITIGNLDISIPDQDTYQWSVEASELDVNNAGNIIFRFVEPAAEVREEEVFNETTNTTENITVVDSPTENLSVEIYEHGNRSNVLYQDEKYRVGEQYKLERLVTEGAYNRTWVVQWEATRYGKSIGGSRIVSFGGYDLVPGFLAGFSELVASLFLLVMAGIFGGRNSTVGAFIVSSFGGIFFLMGWVGTLIGGGAIVLGMALAVLGYVSESQGLR
jgi:hypothetical protein